ncbi:MAG TPA: D-aminoacyl-tRNA deacylase [Anaerolineaceae bacterium]|jgi:D-tyrosyl-tRNA(Tyr) deacylase|nr:D-tyrosyl-tRNA(Tyr) deacylase [Anaerolineaceae bacterium]NMD30669.1 D-tyrosyl-tRNA(Tyr) deacylase [Chloroflexota bacterium]HNZ01728.1 D-aminoacyl-tRNA deacylase [Anaerolineaceae bacterium]HOD44065.1 D-aminoacyl-tRNA deacylase [Anaerolineaceae bacterium]HOH20847.1 D-aminoacyl-tRNA deacylase [Anaerolineaceae bacterium]
MKAVIQRVTRGSVEIDGRRVAEIGPGLVILLGIGPGDTPGVAAKLARKIAMMRIFGDENGKMNLSVLDVQGAAIVVSQFTLYADTRKGHRPAFTDAAPPEIASPLCDQFVAALREAGIPTQTGEFGAHMVVDIQNDGPVTILLEL